MFLSELVGARIAHLQHGLSRRSTYVRGGGGGGWPDSNCYNCLPKPLIIERGTIAFCYQRCCQASAVANRLMPFTAHCFIFTSGFASIWRRAQAMGGGAREVVRCNVMDWSSIITCCKLDGTPSPRFVKGSPRPISDILL